MREMKDSGIEWIGEIPKEWEIKRLKLVLSERNETNNPIKCNHILSLTNNKGVIPYEEKGNLGNKSKDDLTGYKIAYPNDIVLNSMNVIIGSVALSKYFGCVSPVYYMLRKRNQCDCIRYYNYLFQTNELQESLKGYGNGILEIRMRIQMSKLNTVMLPIPPSKKQNAIADFLDCKCNAIDTTIERYCKIIDKLKSYKLSVIDEKVCSASHTEMSVRYCIQSIEQGWSPSAAESVDELNGWNVLSLSAIKQGEFNEDAIKPIDISARVPQKLEVKYGDFLMTRSNTRELVGDVCLVKKHLKQIIFSDLIYRITFNEGLCANYAKYLFISTHVRQQIQEMAQGSSGTMPKISHKSIKEIKIKLPSVEIQRKAVSYLDNKCLLIAKAILKHESMIKKLKEYKKSLIYEAVTGKVEIS